jgi:hypothetical protein
MSLSFMSINDLTERHGFGSIAAPTPTHFQASSLRVHVSDLDISQISSVSPRC